MEVVSILFFAVSLSIVYVSTANVSHDVFKKQAHFHELGVQIKCIEEMLYAKCPSIFETPDTAFAGIIGRRSYDSSLDMKIALAEKTLEDLISEFRNCTRSTPTKDISCTRNSPTPAFMTSQTSTAAISTDTTYQPTATSSSKSQTMMVQSTIGTRTSNLATNITVKQMSTNSIIQPTSTRSSRTQTISSRATKLSTGLTNKPKSTNLSGIQTMPLQTTAATHPPQIPTGFTFNPLSRNSSRTQTMTSQTTTATLTPTLSTDNTNQPTKSTKSTKSTTTNFVYTSTHSHQHAFQVLRSKNVTYRGYDFLALEVRVPVDGLSKSSNWCYDYQYLCADFNRRPTGCGSTYSSDYAYSSCRDKYNSDMNIGDTLGCSPSKIIATVASKAFPNRTLAKYHNTFGFLICGDWFCNKSLAVVSGSSLAHFTDFLRFNVTTFYTLCR